MVGKSRAAGGGSGGARKGSGPKPKMDRESIAKREKKAERKIVVCLSLGKRSTLRYHWRKPGSSEHESGLGPIAVDVEHGDRGGTQRCAD